MAVPSLFVPEQSPVADRASLLMVRPWLEWTRRVTQAIQQLAQTTGGGSVVTAQFQYRFSNSEMWPVASQRLQLNAAHPYTTITAVGVSKQVDGGADVSNFLSRIPVGSRLYIQQNDNSDAYVDVQVTGAPVDQGLYFTIPVSWIANGSDAIANNAAVSMFALMGGGGGGGGTGDVTGPASAVANNIAVFDGTTGKVIKDSGTSVTSLTALGTWSAVAFAGGNFTTNSAGSWTVTVGNVLLNRYAVINKTLLWNIQLSGTVVNAAGTYLQVLVPGGLSISAVAPVQCGISYDNGVDIKAVPFVASPTHIGFRRLDNANWGNSGGATHIYALVTAELL